MQALLLDAARTRDRVTLTEPLRPRYVNLLSVFGQELSRRKDAQMRDLARVRAHATTHSGAAPGGRSAIFSTFPFRRRKFAFQLKDPGQRADSRMWRPAKGDESFGHLSGWGCYHFIGKRWQFLDSALRAVDRPAEIQFWECAGEEMKRAVEAIRGCRRGGWEAEVLRRQPRRLDFVDDWTPETPLRVWRRHCASGEIALIFLGWKNGTGPLGRRRAA